VRAVLGAAICAAILAAGAAGGVTSAPKLSVPDTAPFTVRGVGFKALERVVVTVSSGAARKRTTVTGTAGTFTITFTGVDVGSCDPYVVRALGTKGSKAAVRHTVQEQCGAQPTP
jgi:hypothetical protein